MMTSHSDCIGTLAASLLEMGDNKLDAMMTHRDDKCELLVQPTNGKT